MSRRLCPTARSPARGREAAISHRRSRAARPMPGAIRRTGATPCSPPPTSRCGSTASKRDGLTINPVADRGRQPEQCRSRPRRAAGQLAAAHARRSKRDAKRADRRDRRARSPQSMTLRSRPRRLRPAAQADDARGRSAVQPRQAGRRRPWPGDRLAADRRGVRRQQYRRLRRARGRHDGRARRQDSQRGGISDRRQPGRARRLVRAHHPAPGRRRA